MSILNSHVFKRSSRVKTACRAFAILPVSLITLSQAAADTNQVYLEQGGYVHFEAEDASTVGSWDVNTALNDYTGSGYLEWTGPDYFSENNAGNGIITYHFRVETAGNYELRWRSRIAKGESNTESNDTWVRFSTGNDVAGEEPLSGWAKVYMGEFGIWSWSARTVDHVANPVRQYFSQGDHTLEISGRSYGHAIDRIAMYRYDDVNFDPGLNGTLALSSYVRLDGSTEDPNPIVSPNPATTEPEPENELDERNNVAAIDSSASGNTTAYCSANTLTLPASDAATVNINGLSPTYSRDTLLLEADTSNVLLSFDLTQLPAFTSAKLQYSTGTDISNGTLDVYLGSNSEWVNNSTSTAPDATVQVTAAQGGWGANARYETNLTASLLTQSQTTLIASITSGSDNLSLRSSSGEQPLPVLSISGGAQFCADWEANNNEATTETPDESDTGTLRRSGGGLSYWMLALLLAGMRKVAPATKKS